MCDEAAYAGCMHDSHMQTVQAGVARASSWNPETILLVICFRMLSAIHDPAFYYYHWTAMTDPAIGRKPYQLMAPSWAILQIPLRDHFEPHRPAPGGISSGLH